MIRERWFGGRRSRTFTLQWHLTQACRFHCRHCYDRSSRLELDGEQATRVLEDLQATARRHRVRPQVCLTGGDPLLHPFFWEIYRQAAAMGMHLSVLGNPIAPESIVRLLGIQAPAYYQVSLEGLCQHNDAIRGAGHFDQTMAFLKEARRRDFTTHVMLTLTRANLDQVLPLAEAVRGLTARFTFNRLAQVGEGADLQAPEPDAYAAFLLRYLEARHANPVLGVKDNLFNIIRARLRRPLFPGCTGHGCGAAFDFVALLPDGEVHACRKFPSRIGHILQERLADILASPTARRYRAGPAACRDCRLRTRCGGCPAVTFGRGGDPLEDRDPDCFLQDLPASGGKRPARQVG